MRKSLVLISTLIAFTALLHANDVTLSPDKDKRFFLISLKGLESLNIEAEESAAKNCYIHISDESKPVYSSLFKSGSEQLGIVYIFEEKTETIITVKLGYTPLSTEDNLSPEFVLLKAQKTVKKGDGRFIHFNLESGNLNIIQEETFPDIYKHYQTEYTKRRRRITRR